MPAPHEGEDDARERRTVTSIPLTSREAHPDGTTVAVGSATTSEASASIGERTHETVKGNVKDNMTNSEALIPSPTFSMSWEDRVSAKG